MKIESLTVAGFRSYGASPQTLNLSASLSVVWGQNSQGKSGLGEAIEFLLTGEISRRSLLASAQDEFADALRNAHISAGDGVYVSASIRGSDGALHEIVRTLTADYSKRQACQSSLTVDGQAASEGRLVQLGLVLSQPPLRAPILAQHTLSYIFSAGPQERSTYFKSLLDVVDLEGFRATVAALASEHQPADSPILRKLDRACDDPTLRARLSSLPALLSSRADVQDCLNLAATELLAAADESEHPGDSIARIVELVAERQSQQFPVAGLALPSRTLPSEVTPNVWEDFATFVKERVAVDAEMERLVELYQRALQIPSIAHATESIDCPLCLTPHALTPERVAVLRSEVEKSRGFSTIKTTVKRHREQLRSTSRFYLEQAALLPQELCGDSPLPRLLDRLTGIFGEEHQALVQTWAGGSGDLVACGEALRIAADRLQGALSFADDFSDCDPERVRDAVTALEGARGEYTAVRVSYENKLALLRTALQPALAARAATIGWAEFAEVARDLDGLIEALVEREARNRLGAELQTALKQIDAAKEAVLDDKFSDYSDAVQAWWSLLRPNEPTFFSAVKPRPGARRTIDIKAGMSSGVEDGANVFRDVIAVFSQSQIHCLGLSLFLARAEREGCGFIVLDDPVLSSDDDYRYQFNAAVVGRLLDAGIQTVILTQDETSRRDLENLNLHRDVSIFHIHLGSPKAGTIVEASSDELLSLIGRAEALLRNTHPDVAKQAGKKLRDAAELFCKEMLVSAANATGATTETISTYDNTTLEWLVPRVEPLVNKDASHAGKLRVIKDVLNPPAHGATPAQAAMKGACGDLKRFVKDYLR